MTMVFRQKSDAAWMTLTAAATIYPHPITPHPPTVQLTAISTDTQVLQVFLFHSHPPKNHHSAELNAAMEHVGLKH